MFNYQIRKFIGSYTVAMGGLDCIVFTGGIGENGARIRGSVTKDLEFLGVKTDKDLNENAPRGTMVDISAADSKVRVLVIPTNEELVIARDTEEVVKSL